MTFIPPARIGKPLRVKAGLVEFSYYPVLQTSAGLVLRAKAYSTDAWSLIHASVRQIDDKTNRLNAVPFAEQAHEFYSAALSNSTARAKPLLLYYAFLNLTKALALCAGRATVVGPAYHGLSEHSNTGRSLKSASVTVQSTGSGHGNMFAEFMRAVGCPPAAPNQKFRVHDLIGSSLIGHRLWCEATNRPDCYLRLNPLEILHDKQNRLIWLRVGIRSGLRRRSRIGTRSLISSGFGGAWQQVTHEDHSYSPFTTCWEQTVPLKYKKSPVERLNDLAVLARRTFYRSLTVSEPFRNVYVYVPPRRFKKHHQMASRYVLLYFLGSVTRYHPADFDDYLNSEFGPFLAEFLASEPSQFLFEMACLFAKREVVSVGLA